MTNADLLLSAEQSLDDAHERGDAAAIALWAETAQRLYDNLDPLEHLELLKRTAI